jgi:hypothetical protein
MSSQAFDRFEKTNEVDRIQWGALAFRVNRATIKSCSWPTFLLLVALVPMAAAQDGTSREDGTLPDELRSCRVSSATRTREACEAGPPTILRSEREVTRTLEIAVPATLQCETRIDLEYVQRDTLARVNGVIENETCAASSGNYEIEVQVEDENGETTTLVFGESWQRDDDRPVAFAADYPIGENVELIRIRSRRLRCTCGDDSEE